jgi:putative endonuclease
MGKTQESGNRAESLAADMLVRHGLTLVERNYRCRQGEIDLIMRHDGSLVFVEVRLRRNPRFGDAFASVDHRKQQRLVRAAQHYLARSGWQGPCRFDVVGFDSDMQAEWLKDALQT